ncbi:P-loop containing nucleoside triphosphate hydrolase protein [Ceratobasidium sp. AG-I]|nr:P-loop containing nucleoside triphosphate hydrolase protein [Ceratobasidium sp. AG-I]
MSPPKPTKSLRIAVMGLTGAGKSTFVNHLTGAQNLPHSSSLASCTTSVEAHRLVFRDHYLTLVDTPGFDDSHRDEYEILREIATSKEFSGSSDDRALRFNGVLYFHRISDTRTAGAAMRHFRSFQNICGRHAMKNVIIVTNMWEQVDLETGSAREDELRFSPKLFKPAMDDGARMMRHYNKVESSRELVGQLLGREAVGLQLQEELMVQRVALSQTVVARGMNEQLVTQHEKQQQELNKVARDLKEATRRGDEETVEELKVEELDLTQAVRDTSRQLRRRTEDRPAVIQTHSPSQFPTPPIGPDSLPSTQGGRWRNPRDPTLGSHSSSMSMDHSTSPTSFKTPNLKLGDVVNSVISFFHRKDEEHIPQPRQTYPHAHVVYPYPSTSSSTPSRNHHSTPSQAYAAPATEALSRSLSSTSKKHVRSDTPSSSKSKSRSGSRTRVDAQPNSRSRSY